MGDVFYGQVGTGGWEEPDDAYVVVASMLLVAMAIFPHLCLSEINYSVLTLWM